VKPQQIVITASKPDRSDFEAAGFQAATGLVTSLFQKISETIQPGQVTTA